MALADTARLIASLTLEDKGFARGLSNAEKGLGRLETTAFRVGQNIGSGLKAAASNIAKLGVGAGVAAAGGLVKSIQLATDLAENQSKVNVVFGESAGIINEWSKTSATAMGASQSAALAYAGTLGNLFDALGLSEEASIDMTKGTVELAADLASFNNLAGGTEEALEKLRAGLVGEAEPLRALGVNLTAATTKAKALELGLGDANGELTEAEKVQARYALILEQTTNAQGDFSRTSGGLANQIRILKASLSNTGAVIGTALLPKVTELAVKFNKLITDNQPAIAAFAAELPAIFDKAVAFVESVPWDAIASAATVMGAGAKIAMDAFLAAPPWLQTAVITGWGLNKLTGGALGGIAGELGKSLIKGVLGIQAAQVNITAANVTGAGGPGVAAAGGNKTSVLPAVGVAGIILSLAVPIGEAFAAALPPGLKGEGGQGQSESQRRITEATKSLETKLVGKLDLLKGSVDRSKDDTVAATNRNAALLAAAAGRSTEAQKAAIAAASAQQLAAIASAKAANQAAAFAIRDRVSAGSAATVAAVDRKDLSVEVNVKPPSVSIYQVISGQNTVKTIYRTQS